VVQLPVSIATPVVGLRPESPARRTITPLPILLVEDNAMLSYAFALELRLDGHDVRTAADGQSALAGEAGFRPKVILLDLGLPDMDGHDVARRLRERAPDEQPVIVALTGRVQEQDRRSSRESGCDYHLVKPVDIDLLRSILAAIGSRPNETGRPAEIEYR
jgi:DNA-binding response OmpR family regulator